MPARCLYLLLIFALLLSAGCAATPSSHTAIPPAAAVASAHPLATAAGIEILAAGGNAFDAAVAVSAALAVVEPTGSGLGGGGFWLLHRAADGRQVMLDGREMAPAAAHRDMYLDAAGKVIPNASIDGPRAAGIPGAPAALDHLARHYGRLPLSASLAPAIHLAEQGFAVDEPYRRMAGFRLAALQTSPAAAAIFLENNQVPAPGFVIRQPDLAKTLRTIAAQGGAAGFYQGEIAQRLVAGSRAAGGIWTEQDLRDYRIIERAPIIGHYRDLRIVSAAPPSSGGIALVTMLNILAGYPLEQLGESRRVHLIVEAMRRAYRDRAEYLGDPDFVDPAVAQLTSPLYAAGLRAGIHPDRATPSANLPGQVAEVGGNHTTHFSILDQAGNRVAATLSINYPFGSGFVPPGTGVLLNDEMDDFSTKPGVPNAYGLVGAEANAIAPGKRPLSSMTPTFLESDRGIALLGTPGGSRIITMVLLATLDHAAGGAPDHWVARPRFHHQYLPDVIQYEPEALTPALIEALAAKGHPLKALDDTYGNMQAILWDTQRGVVRAASDPRGIGRSEVKVIPPR